jgi:hypothetical protein
VCTLKENFKIIYIHDDDDNDEKLLYSFAKINFVFSYKFKQKIIVFFLNYYYIIINFV